MEKAFAKIEFSKNNNILCMTLNINDALSRHETRVDYDKKTIDTMLPWWIMKSVKPLFFEMPLEKIEKECSKEIYHQFGKILEQSTTAIMPTNDIIKRYHHLKGVSEDNQNILFVNIDDSPRGKGLYNKFCRSAEKKLRYLNIATGWDANALIFKIDDVPMPLTDLVDFIVTEKIKKIVSYNQYFLEMYLYKTGIYLPGLFRHLGVEYIIIDYDEGDDLPHGYLMKAFFHCNSFNRFALAHLFNKHWDNKLELKNIHYITLPQDYEDDSTFQDIKDDYAILVLSNSRLPNVKQKIMPILYILDHMPENSVFTEIQRWYLALKYMILNMMQLDEMACLNYNSMLHSFFYTAMQFLKYEIIESIDTTREIEIYGDIGWKSLFPQYYKNYLNTKEISALFSANSHLYLQLNYVISYLEASGSVYDAIKRKVPFINMPALVKDRFFEGFRHIEYKNKQELNYLIENIRQVIDNKELKESTRMFTQVLQDSENTVLEKIVFDNYNIDQSRPYERACQNKQVLLEETVKEYIKHNEPLLRESFSVFFQGKPVQFDITKSRYFERAYVQRILKLIKDEQSAAA